MDQWRVQQGASSSIANSPSSTAARQRQQQEATGKLIRSILSCNETGQNQSSKARPTNSRLGLNGRVSNDIASLECDFDTKIVSNDKFRKKALHGSGSGSEKHEKHTRNKDRPDHGIWSPLHCPDVPKASENYLTPSVLQSAQASCNPSEGEKKSSILSGSSGHNIPLKNG
ncbi:hypothetical protein ES288_D06G139900v1 [Gossypium darwinii]|uniref:Uncharacterized protein n=1 Tax=Gossypium darwinii TaxID=34276 RepID=A0A5D2C9S7_GOSDA|nr:hypothetical protein ES288_D06G139900v1 [Gossypium darwinii]